MERKLTVADVMTENVVVLREEDNLLDVASGLERFRFRHLPVVDGRRLIGIVTQRDLLRCTVSQLEHSGPGAAARDRALKEQTFVSIVMTRNPETIAPNASIADAAKKLVHGRFGCLPVVDANDELLGIVTEHDLLKVLAELA